MNLSIQLHLSTYPANRIHERSSVAIRRWLNTSAQALNKISASIVITDEADFAHAASETNDVVILVSDAAETVPQKVEVIEFRNLEEDMVPALRRFDDRAASK